MLNRSDNEAAFLERRTKRQQLRDRIAVAATKKAKTKRALSIARREVTPCRLEYEDASIELNDLQREIKS